MKHTALETIRALRSTNYHTKKGREALRNAKTRNRRSQTPNQMERSQGRNLNRLSATGAQWKWQERGCLMARLTQRLDERQDYETPPELVAQLAAEFGPFETDFAATEANKKAPRCFTPEMDSLSLEWSGVGFLNPPYGKMTKPFVKKASEAEAKVTCLLPARTDTRWFHEFVLPKAKVVRFLKGRVKFPDRREACAGPENWQAGWGASSPPW